MALLLDGCSFGLFFWCWFWSFFSFYVSFFGFKRAPPQAPRCYLEEPVTFGKQNGCTSQAHLWEDFDGSVYQTKLPNTPEHPTTWKRKHPPRSDIFPLSWPGRTRETHTGGLCLLWLQRDQRQGHYPRGVLVLGVFSFLSGCFQVECFMAFFACAGFGRVCLKGLVVTIKFVAVF